MVNRAGVYFCFAAAPAMEGSYWRVSHSNTSKKRWVMFPSAALIKLGVNAWRETKQCNITRRKERKGVQVRAKKKSEKVDE